MQLLQELHDEEDMQAFCDRWSVDSDGNRHEAGQRAYRWSRLLAGVL